MAKRISRLLRETNISLENIEKILRVLGYDESPISLSTKIPEDIAILVECISNKDIDLLELIELTCKDAHLNSVQGIDVLSKLAKKYEHNNAKKYQTIGDADTVDVYNTNKIPNYDDNNSSFWIEDLIIISPECKATRLNIGTFEEQAKFPLYSVLIGCNGVGKSSILKEIIDFFIELQTKVNEKDSKASFANKGRLRGIKYHIDGCLCEVVKLESRYRRLVRTKIC